MQTSNPESGSKAQSQAVFFHGTLRTLVRTGKKMIILFGKYLRLNFFIRIFHQTLLMMK